MALRKKILALLLLIPCLLLNGCALNTQPEHQAYAISLSVDRTDTGEIETAVQVPSIRSGSSSGSSESSGGGTGYVIFSATAGTLTESLDLLSATIPRALQLAHLKSIVISMALAQEPGFEQMLEELLLTYHIYGACRVVISLCKAKDFISAQQPSIGTRISSGLAAALEHYFDQGYVPMLNLMDVYNSLNAPFSDPVLILASTSDGKNYRSMPLGRVGDALPGALPRSGTSKNEYMGSAIVSHDRVVGVLTGLETQWMNVLRGELHEMSYTSNGQRVTLTMEASPIITIDDSASPMRIVIRISISVAARNEQLDTESLAELIRTDIINLIDHCRSLDAEPFKFAQRAATRFTTVDEFVQWGFKERYLNAQFDIRLKITENTT